MKQSLLIIGALILGFVLVSYIDDDTTTSEDTANKEQIPTGILTAAEQATGLDFPDLPEDAPEIGTSVINLFEEKDLPPVDTSGAEKILWEDLIPKDFQADTLLARYQDQINAIPEGSLEEIELYDTIIAELNSAPANEAMNNKKIRLPGFVAPLDEKNGMVSEFLLVPYFGSCIHAPPPPVNQTILVRDIKRSIPMEKIYDAVWVTGDLSVERLETGLAHAGYLVENAQLEIYDPDKEAYHGAQPEGEAGTPGSS